MSGEELFPGFDKQLCEGLEIKLKRADKKNNSISLSLSGSIDAYNSDCFWQKMTKVVEAGFVKLTFEIRSISTISSTGVATFLRLQGEATRMGGEITLVGVPPKIKGVFDLLCLGEVFRCIETDE